MTRRRVAITGLGVISSVGLTVDSFWDSLINGRSGIRRITRFDPSDYTSRIAGEVRDFVPENYMEAKLARRVDRFTQLGMAAAGDALKACGVDATTDDPSRMGVIIGTGIGGLNEMEEQYEVMKNRGPGRVSPFLVPKLMGNACSGQVAIQCGFTGPNMTILSACASASHSVIEAFRLIQNGGADVMVAGGSEAAITPLGVAGFCALKALSTRNDEPERASRPFDKDRDGFVIGEAAGVIVLEEYERARKRGANIICTLVGAGMSCDSFHITQPDPSGDGAVASMRGALRDAGLNPDEIDYINAHGTSTKFNDATESAAIRKLFGDYAYKLAVSSTKSMVGHSLGASGGVELVACALTIRDGVIHPTINYETPDPACDLDYVPNQARKADVKYVLSNSFGFGGHNATIALGPAD